MRKKIRRVQPSDPIEKRRASWGFWLGVIGSVIALAATAAGVISYYYSKEFEAKKASLEADYKTQSEGLELNYQNRLRSIELGLGDQQRYFDVEKILIPPAAVYDLPSTMKRFQLGPEAEIYVEDYPGGDWEFIKSNEFDLTEMMVGREQALREAADLGLSDQLAAAELHLFIHPERHQVDFTNRRRDVKAARKINFFPVIVVQPVQHSSISKALGLEKARVAEALLQKSRASDPATVLSKDMLVAQILDDTFRSDFVGHVLNSLIDGGFKYVSDYEGAKYRIVSLQKVRNVLFLHSRLIFTGLPESGSGVQLRVEELAFFISGIDRSFFIRAYIPLTDSNSPHLAWVMRWLTGIRVVWT